MKELLLSTALMKNMRKRISNKKRLRFYLRVNLQYYLFQFTIQKITVKLNRRAYFFDKYCYRYASTTILQKAKPKQIEKVDDTPIVLIVKSA